MNYQNMTDQELVDIRKAMPKYLNDMTEEQRITSHEVYAEQKRRFDAEKIKSYAVYNRKVEAAGYKVGDKVSYFARSMIGFEGITITGKVAKRKKYYVALDMEVNGKKSAHLTNTWKHI